LRGDSGTFCLEFTADSKLGTYRKIWENTEAVCNYASPLVWEENVYIVDSRGFVHCLNRYDGKHRFEEKLPDVCWATPFVADGNILFFSIIPVQTMNKSSTVDNVYVLFPN
jgi:outer membrane protein assembly factor BamB